MTPHAHRIFKSTQKMDGVWAQVEKCLSAKVFASVSDGSPCECGGFDKRNVNSV